MLQDILEASWTFREMRDELTEKLRGELSEKLRGELSAEFLQQGQAQGLAQMRQTIVNIVQEHFPALARLATEIVATINDPAQLVRLSVMLGGARSAEEVHQLLLQWAQ
jgi:hypothetical protein